MSQQRLHVLTLDELQCLSYALGIKPRSTKQAVIKGLVESQVKYGELANMDQMKRMLGAEEQRFKGRRAELELRLIETHPGPAGPAAAQGASAPDYDAYCARVVTQQNCKRSVACDELEAAVAKNPNNELVRRPALGWLLACGKEACGLQRSHPAATCTSIPSAADAGCIPQDHGPPRPAGERHGGALEGRAA